MTEHSASESDGDPWAAAASEMDVTPCADGASGTSAQPSSQPAVLVPSAAPRAHAASSCSARGRPSTTRVAVQPKTSPGPKRQMRRTRYIREAFADIAGSEDEFNRDEQLAEARSRKILKRPAARPEVAPVVLVGAAGNDGPPQHGTLVVQAIPSVPAGIMQELSSGLGESRGQLPLQSFVKGVMQIANPPREPQGHVRRLAEWYCSPGKQRARTATKRAIADSTGVPDRRVGDITRSLASTAVHCDRELRHTLEALVVGSVEARRLLCYVEFETSDETPMKMGVAEGTRFARPGDISAFGSLSSSIPQHTGLPSSSSIELPRAVVCKILQSSSQFAMLVEGASGNLLTITGATLNWLQLLSRTTGEVLTEAARRREGLSIAAQRFQVKTRIATLDRAASNKRSEKAIMASRTAGDPGWEHMVLPCEVHQTASAHKRAFDGLCTADVSGQIHWALTINASTNSKVFGLVIREYVKESMVIIRGRPPADAVAYRRDIMNLCMQRGSKILSRRLSLELLPNGDWRKRGVVEVYIPENVPCDHERIREVVSSAIHQSLASCHMTVFPRHRWTNGDKAFDNFILLEALHGLVSAVWQRFCLAVGQVGGSRNARAGMGSAKDAAAVLPKELLPLEDVGISAPDTVAAAPEEAELDGAAGADADSFREEQEAHRRLATEWLQTGPLVRATIMRFVMEPLVRLLRSQLHVGGASWDQRQDAAEASALASMQAQGRNFPIAEAAQGRLEAQAHRGFKLLLHETRLWENVVPLVNRTLDNVHLAFRLVACADGSIAESLDLQHSRFPVRLFKLLAGGLAEDVLQTPACCLDAWSLAFVARHRGAPGGLTSPHAMAELRTHALVAKMDISAVESGHASIRRRVMSRSVQTHAESVEEVSAEFVLDGIRNRWQPLAPSSGEPDAGSANAGDAAARRNPQRAGPWRAFVREKALGQRGLPDLKLVGKEYKALPAEEKARLEHLGRAAARSDPAPGQGSFGPKSRDVQRNQAKRHKAAAAAQQVALHRPPSGGLLEDTLAGVAVEQAISASKGADMTVKEVLGLARAHARQEGLATSSAEEKQAATLQRWMSEDGPREMMRVLEDFPRLAPWTFALEPSPCAMQSMLRMKAPAQLVVQVAEAVASRAQQSNLRKGLLHQWEALHQPIMHDDCKPLENPSVAETRTDGHKTSPQCVSAGFCVCEPALRRLRSAFYRQLKALCPAGSLAREALRLGKLVAKLQSESLPTEGEAPSAWSAATREVDGDSSPEEEHATIFWHLSCMRFSPYSAVFRGMELVKEGFAFGSFELHLEVVACGGSERSVGVVHTRMGHRAGKPRGLKLDSLSQQKMLEHALAGHQATLRSELVWPPFPQVASGHGPNVMSAAESRAQSALAQNCAI